MKTQISRDSFQPDKRYSGIHQQQGRMITDADWNELAAICRDQLSRALADVVGDGSPRTGAVSITADRKIQPGDLYVDGIRAELPGSAAIAANAQPDLPGYPPFPAAGPYVVYADVWDRAVTSLEDGALRDPGLHGADTCTRSQTMLQVKTCPATLNPETGIARKGNATLSLSLHTNLEAGDPCDPCAGLISAGKGRVGSYLFRLEVHALEGEAANPTRLILKWSSENGAEQYDALPVEQMPPGFVSAKFVYEFHNLATEKYLGLFPGTGFTPTRGAITASYEIPAVSPKELVRRWDGYCELTRSGATWSLAAGRDRGVELHAGGSDTAPGYVKLGAAVQMNLEAMKLTLDLAGRTFVPGDFWLAPVREAVLNPGDPLVSGEEPRGVTHRYFRLARVQADGTVIPFDSDADRRRHRFPPLTDLRAHDVGYATTCSSGLFNPTHDNVEKALNRLCQLAAEHVAFAKPCDTSIYQDKAVSTVADALKLLCDIRAGHVSYRPGGACTYLDQPGIDTVQDALDALCARPSGGGCRITVGKGGMFSTLEEALKTLIEKGVPDICLCLLPGDHGFEGREILPDAEGVHLCLTGCGHGARLHLLKEPARFRGFAAICLSDMEIITEDSPTGALDFVACRDVSLRGLAVYGLVTEGALVRVSDSATVSLRCLELEACAPASTETPFKILEIHPALAGLFNGADRNVFDRKLPEAARYLADMAEPAREELASAISERVKTLAASLAVRERQSYQVLIALLRAPVAHAAELAAALAKIRVEAVRERPAAALAVADAKADWTLVDCDILGGVMLYGLQPSGPLPDDMVKNLDALIKQRLVNFGGVGTTFRISGCRLTRIDFSVIVRQRLADIVASHGGTVPALFSSALLSDMTCLSQDNQMVFLNTSLSSSVFEVAAARAALVMGTSSIYVGNRGEGEAVIVNLVPQGRSQQTANLGLLISG